MTKNELASYFVRYAKLDREWCVLYDNECETGKIAPRMRQIHMECEVIIDEVAFQLGLKDEP